MMEVAVAEWLCGGPSKSAYAGSIPARDSHRSGSVAEMADAPDLKSGDLAVMWVRIPPLPPTLPSGQAAARPSTLYGQPPSLKMM